jgi:hypothetical protein
MTHDQLRWFADYFLTRFDQLIFGQAPDIDLPTAHFTSTVEQLLNMENPQDGAGFLVSVMEAIAQILVHNLKQGFPDFEKSSPEVKVVAAGGYIHDVLLFFHVHPEEFARELQANIEDPAWVRKFYVYSRAICAICGDKFPEYSCQAASVQGRLANKMARMLHPKTHLLELMVVFALIRQVTAPDADLERYLQQADMFVNYKADIEKTTLFPN